MSLVMQTDTIRIVGGITANYELRTIEHKIAKLIIHKHISAQNILNKFSCPTNYASGMENQRHLQGGCSKGR